MGTLKSRLYVELLEATLRDAYLATSLSRHAQTLSLNKDIDCARRRMSTEGTSFYSKELAMIGNSFTRSLDGISQFQPVGLARYRNKTVRSVLPAFARSLFLQTHTDDGYLRKEATPGMVQHIRSVLYLTYKMREEFDCENLADFAADFTGRDRHLSQVPFSIEAKTSFQDDINWSGIDRRWRAVIMIARHLVSRVLSNADPSDILPSHGPGAVSGGEKPWEKPYHRKMAEPMGDVYDISYYVSGSHALADMIGEWKQGLVHEDVARVLFVPKDSRGPRVITCEPVAKQWIQQGLMRSLRKAISEHYLTKDTVVLDDQSVNGVLACLSSVLGSYATLDLKDASDCITCELVRALFPKHWYDALMAARSPMYRIQGSEEICKLVKFAGMGNATTFPTETLCFWALSQALLLKRTDTHYGGFRPIDRRVYNRLEIEKVYAYGDDLVVPSTLVDELQELFSYVGLVVNTKKSFSTGRFREACGYDAFDGQNVAPVRLKGLIDAMDGDVASLAGLVQTCNRIWMEYPNLTYYLHGLLKERYPWLRNWNVAPPGSVVFQLPHITVDKDVRRWNSKLQRIEFRVPVVTPVYMDRKMGEDSHHHWCDVLQVLVKPGLRVYEDPVADRYSIPNRSQIRFGWRSLWDRTATNQDIIVLALKSGGMKDVLVADRLAAISLSSTMTISRRGHWFVRS